MSSLADSLLLMSLSLNGVWIATRIIRWAGSNSVWLVRITLGLFGLVVLLRLGVIAFHFSSEALDIDKAISSIAFSTCLWCCWRLMELLPRPWGNAPKKRKPLDQQK